MLPGWGVGSPKDPWVAPSPPPRGPRASLGSAPRWDTAAGGLGEPRGDHKSGETEARHSAGAEHRRCLGWVPGVGIAHRPPPRGGNFWQTCVGAVDPQVCPMGVSSVGGPGGGNGAGKPLGATPTLCWGSQAHTGGHTRGFESAEGPRHPVPPPKSPPPCAAFGDSTGDATVPELRGQTPATPWPCPCPCRGRRGSRSGSCQAGECVPGDAHATPW